MDERFKQLRTVIAKVTNRCNIRCKYCYEHIMPKGADMSPDMFLAVVRSTLASTAQQKLLLVLHGGEPTVLPTRWFKECLTQARELAREFDKTLELAIQTNLIEIEDSKLLLFKEYDVGVGGSIDNPAFIPSNYRPLAQKALSTFFRARELGLKVGLLSTINSSNIHCMAEFCDWLMSTVEVRHFKANIAYPVGAGINMKVPTSSEVFQAQRSILDFMVQSDGRLLEENLSQELIRFFESHKGGRDRAGTLCDDKRCGAGKSVIGISPDGQLLPCGRFAWSEQQHSLGSILDISPEAASSFSQRASHFHQLNPENWADCGDCSAASICSFGCQAFIARSIQRTNIECKPTKLRFEYYERNANNLQTLYEKICNRKGRPSMSPLQQKFSRLERLVPQSEHHRVRTTLIKALQQQ